MLKALDKPREIGSLISSLIEIDLDYPIIDQRRFYGIKLKNYTRGILRIKLKYDPPLSQPAITCSKLTIETLKQGVKYFQR